MPSNFNLVEFKNDANNNVASVDYVNDDGDRMTITTAKTVTSSATVTSNGTYTFSNTSKGIAGIAKVVVAVPSQGTVAVQSYSLTEAQLDAEGEHTYTYKTKITKDGGASYNSSVNAVKVTVPDVSRDAPVDVDLKKSEAQSIMPKHWGLRQVNVPKIDDYLVQLDDTSQENTQVRVNSCDMKDVIGTYGKEECVVLPYHDDTYGFEGIHLPDTRLESKYITRAQMTEYLKGKKKLVINPATDWFGMASVTLPQMAVYNSASSGEERTFTANGTYNITPTGDYDAMTDVKVIVDVPETITEVKSLNIDETQYSGSVLLTPGKADALSAVQVSWDFTANSADLEYNITTFDRVSETINRYTPNVIINIDKTAILQSEAEQLTVGDDGATFYDWSDSPRIVSSLQINSTVGPPEAGPPKVWTPAVMTYGVMTYGYLPNSSGVYERSVCYMLGFTDDLLRAGFNNDDVNDLATTFDSSIETFVFFRTETTYYVLLGLGDGVIAEKLKELYADGQTVVETQSCMAEMVYTEYADLPEEAQLLLGDNFSGEYYLGETSMKDVVEYERFIRIFGFSFYPETNVLFDIVEV